MSWTVNPLTLSQRYDEGYFHGRDSGYPTEGYEHVHPSWRYQLRIAQATLGKGIRWLDVGCAYGFLIEEAEKYSVEAIGTDISAYALRQHPPVRDHLLQAEASCLPFQDSSLDVVSAFDLLEHLVDPVRALREWKRILRPDGLLFLSTPDPCTFNRKEPTHVSERPPSFWITCLEENGFEPLIRFGGEFFELDICARLTGNTSGFELPALATGHSDDIFPTQRQGDVFIVPRGGWGSLHTDEKGRYRWIGKTSALYFLNAGKRPTRCRLSIHTRSESHPDATIGDLRLRHLRSQESPTFHEWEPFDLPAGGSILRLSVGEGPALQAERIEVEILPIQVERYLDGLPFDLYQRYRLVSEVVDVLDDASQKTTILEVGGAGSPLPDFLPSASITVTDLQWEDRPRFRTCDAENLPFVDGRFDWVVGCDFLEHVPADRRDRILTELKRVAQRGVILIGPMESEAVLEADALLRRFLVARFGRDNQFLAEHEKHGLPNADQVEKHLSADAWHCCVLPSGLLERWLPMQLCTGYLESVPELFPLRQEINRLYNRTYYRRDNDNPAYRTLLLASSRKLDSATRKKLTQLIAQPSDSEVSWGFAAFLTELLNIDLLRERSDEAGQRDRHIAELLSHTQALQESQDRIAHHASNLEADLGQAEKHAGNLADLLDREQEERGKLIQHATDLRDHIKQLEEHIGALQKDADARRTQWQDLQKHADNLITLLSQRDEQATRLERHAANLEERLSQLLRHTENLDKLLTEREEHTRNLEKLLTESEERNKSVTEHGRDLEKLLAETEERTQSLLEHSQNLEKLLTQREERIGSLLEHAHNLERLITEKDGELTQLRETASQLEDRLRRIKETLPFRFAAKVGGKKWLAGGKPMDSSRSPE